MKKDTQYFVANDFIISETQCGICLSIFHDPKNAQSMLGNWNSLNGARSSQNFCTDCLSQMIEMLRTKMVDADACFFDDGNL